MEVNMQRFRQNKIVMMFLVLVFIIGCANLQQKWNNLTDDEQGRVILNGLQDQLDIWFDAGKAFVKDNPTYQTEWQTKVIPSFDVANKAVGQALLSKTTPDTIYMKIAPQVSKVIEMLRVWGVFVK